MFYFSLILDKPIKDEQGNRIGKVVDMATHLGENFPPIDSIIQRGKNREHRIKWGIVKHIDHEGVIIKGKNIKLPPYKEEKEILLKRDILDKQIVDINGHRVVRVNDIQLNLVDGILRLAGVDIGTAGLLRRLGFLDVTEKITQILKIKTPTNIIPWDKVQTITPTDSSLKLATTYKKLTTLHPADLADILEDLSSAQRAELFRSLDTETAAETLEHLEDEVQISLFRSLPDEKASDILEEMSPDEAADILQDLPEERASRLLKLMEPEEAEDVRELLAYEEDTAGGLMSTEFVSAKKEMTCQETIELIRKLSPDAELVYYIYVLDEKERLIGVLSLRDLIVHTPTTQLQEIMVKDILYVHEDAELDEITELIAKYDLLAVPVVTKDFVLKGIITFDDVLDLLIPKEKSSLFHID